MSDADGKSHAGSKRGSKSPRKGGFGIRNMGSGDDLGEYAPAPQRRFSDGVPAPADPPMSSMSNIPGIPVSVMGVTVGNIPDPRMAALTRKVIKVAMVLAILALIDMITSIAADASHAGLSSIVFLIALLFPLCGLWGARKSNAQLLGCFCSCALLNAVLTVVNTVMLIRFLVQLRRVEGHCKRHESGCINPENGAKYSEDEVSKWVRQVTIIMVVHVLVGIGVIILNLIAFVWGNALFQRVRAGQVVVAAPFPPPTQIYHPQGRVVIGHPAGDSGWGEDGNGSQKGRDTQWAGNTVSGRTSVGKSAESDDQEPGTSFDRGVHSSMRPREYPVDSEDYHEVNVRLDEEKSGRRDSLV